MAFATLERALTAGVEQAALAWLLSDRQRPGEGAVRAVFKRKAQRLEIRYALSEGKALIDAGKGRVLQLALAGGEAEAGNPAAWTCDCPAGATLLCLHAALAARGLADEVATGAAADEPPDASFAVGLEASEALIAAAARSHAVLERTEEGLRVGEATVARTEKGLGCDCPLGTAPVCLHRVLVDAWARGVRPARPAVGQAAAVARGLATRATVLPEERPVRAGQKLPPQDVDRFTPVLDRVDALVLELLTFGLQRMTQATLERVDALVLQARALGVRDGAPREAGLGRLVRALETVRQTLDEFQNRLVTTTERDVLRVLAVARNLTRAVRANTGALPLIDFAGATQQEYDPVPVLDVQGLGLEAWVTPTGFAGVTAYLVDCRTARIYTRTQTLPEEVAVQFAGRFGRGGGNGWADSLAAQAAFGGRSESYLDLARGRFLLSGALLAQDSGRLSGSAKTQLAKRPPLPWDDARLRVCTVLDRTDAVRLSRRFGFDPLGRPPSSPPLVLMPVASFSEAHFDVARQELGFVVRTPSGLSFPCELPFREDRQLWIENLEKLTRALTPPKALLVRARLDPVGFRIEPLTAYFDKGPPQHLTFKPLDVPARAALQVLSVAVPKAAAPPPPMSLPPTPPTLEKTP